MFRFPKTAEIVQHFVDNNITPSKGKGTYEAYLAGECCALPVIMVMLGKDPHTSKSPYNDMDEMGGKSMCFGVGFDDGLKNTPDKGGDPTYLHGHFVGMVIRNKFNIKLT